MCVVPHRRTDGPFWRGETGAAWEFHGSDGSAGAPWLSIHLCRCGLAFTVCLGVVTPVASWCSMVQRDAPWSAYADCPLALLSSSTASFVIEAATTEPPISMRTC